MHFLTENKHEDVPMLTLEGGLLILLQASDEAATQMVY